jgi:putative ABC transport system permease protein
VTGAIHLSTTQVVASLALVAVAIAISLWQRADLEREIAIAVARSAVQLIAVGYVIDAIFSSERIVFVVALLAAMVVFGAFTARKRAPGVPGAFWPLLIALALAAAATIGLVVALDVFQPTPRYLVPVGGMVIGNAMTAAAVALNRLGDDMHASARDIEAALALGATAAQAARPIARRSLRSAMIPLIDSTKTTGLIFFPGTMVGMLLAGAAPFDAVRLQLVLLYVLLGSVAIASLTAVALSHRRFFTSAHQLLQLTQ